MSVIRWSYFYTLVGILSIVQRSFATEDPPIPIDGEEYACSHPHAFIKQIDHVASGAIGTPSALNAAYHELNVGLGFPAAYPYGNYSNDFKGGLAVGDINIELKYIKKGNLVIHESAVALEPCATEDSNLLSQVHERGLAVTVFGRQAKVPQNYTGFTFNATSGPATALVINYHHDQALRRAGLFRQQLLVGGGPLGVMAAAAVHVDVGNTTMDLWRRIAAPRRVECDAKMCSINMGAGPALVLHVDATAASGMLRLRAIVWTVVSVSQVTQVLKERGLLGEDPVEPEFQKCRILSLGKFQVETPAKLLFCPVSTKARQWIV